MKTVMSLAVGMRTVIIFVICVCGGCFVPGVFAQTNSWTNSASGNWEDFHWSLGVLPGTNQTILFTNQGVKALTISSDTAQNFPEAMSVNSLTLSSPAESANILFLNYTGFQTPLAVHQLTLDTNSLMLAYGSALQISDYAWISGEFVQDANSQITNNQLYVDGNYSLMDGTLNSGLEKVWAYGRFTQSAGTNRSYILLEAGAYGEEAPGAAEYDLDGGCFEGGITIRNGGVFNQRGGVARALNFGIDGAFIQSGGIFNGPTNSPLKIPSLLFETPHPASALQTGGTNQQLGLIIGLSDLQPENSQGVNGSCQGVPPYGGSYTLSNGVLMTSGVVLRANGTFNQSGGINTVNGDLTLQGALYYSYSVSRGYVPNPYLSCAKLASYSLADGILTASNLHVGIAGDVLQSGGTNIIAGDLTLSGPQAQLGSPYSGSYDLSGGLLIVSNIYELGFGVGHLSQTAGHLIVGNLSLERMEFNQTGGTITQSGLLTFFYGMQVAAGRQQFGRLLLEEAAPFPVLLSLPADAACVVQFADCSSMVWSNGAMLGIPSWSGSLYGGGQQQIIFGTNAAALTPQQLSQIQFQDPTGLAPGNYPARILATGEIVPDSGAPLPVKVTLLNNPTNGAMHLSIGGDIGRTYTIEASTDLVHWNSLTDQFNAVGTISLDDCDATNCLQRFYRAQLVP
jgi:hypothetical protein